MTRWTILLLATAFGLLGQQSNGQTRKIILGGGDTTYYTISKKYANHDNPFLKYKLKEPLPDGQWLIYSIRDTSQLLRKISYKDKKKNDYLVSFFYTSNYDTLTGKTIQFFKDGKMISYLTYHYDNAGAYNVTYHSKYFRNIRSCKGELGFPNFPYDSVINYLPDGTVSSKQYYKKCNETGTWQYWDENGKLYKEEFYKIGKLLKTKKY